MTKTTLKNTLGWILTVCGLTFFGFLFGVTTGSNPLIIVGILLFIAFTTVALQIIKEAIVNKAIQIKSNIVKKLKGQK